MLKSHTDASKVSTGLRLMQSSFCKTLYDILWVTNKLIFLPPFHFEFGIVSKEAVSLFFLPWISRVEEKRAESSIASRRTCPQDENPHIYKGKIVPLRTS